MSTVRCAAGLGHPSACRLLKVYALRPAGRRCRRQSPRPLIRSRGFRAYGGFQSRPKLRGSSTRPRGARRSWSRPGTRAAGPRQASYSACRVRSWVDRGGPPLRPRPAAPALAAERGPRGPIRADFGLGGRGDPLVTTRPPGPNPAASCAARFAGASGHPIFIGGRRGCLHGSPGTVPTIAATRAASARSCCACASSLAASTFRPRARACFAFRGRLSRLPH